MKITAKVSFLVGSGGHSSIELIDKDSGMTLFRSRFIPDDVIVRLLGREAHDVEGEGSDHIERVGMRWEVASHIFGLPRGVHTHSNDVKRIAWERAQATCPPGWTPRNYFGSQDSFFERDEVTYARCTIDRWIPRGGEPNETETDT